MKNNLTAIAMVLDRSGSMLSLTNNTLEGVNQFIADQKNYVGECLFTLATFNRHYKMIYDCVPLSSVAELTTKDYQASGTTALLDAVGALIDNLGMKLAAMKEEDRPSKVLVCVITDGAENASNFYTKAKIKEMVEHQTNKYNWQFLYLGANVDAFTEGTNMGFQGQNTILYKATPIGTGQMYNSLSRSTSRFRSSTTAVIPVDDLKDLEKK